ncbi:formyltetrahydrofolate deformylase [Nocardia sp. R7R-8]|uniref:formyltetrahydrofolate deformylase n=1 Tax=Nocardia sp. R7R-8 TaxID=3459304 RepID=UPI00403E2C80
MTDQRARRGVLALSCPDVPGIVHAVAGFLVDRCCTILESKQFGDPDSGTFFMRVEFGHADTHRQLDIATLRHQFAPLAADLRMRWRLVDASARQRVAILVSKFAHCLNDLLFRTFMADVNIDVVAVISNHPDLRPFADHYSVPFEHIPLTPDTKREAEAQLLELIQREQIDLVVLARYMQILSETLCKELEGRAINIHHSMLPSFKGARPYHQAHARGVKLIGATAHYVTSDLDEGPIIEQELVQVDHSMSVQDLVARGREAECRALARAVRGHVENRVFLNGNKTVVLG